MPHPLLKTEIDAARLLLQAGWRPDDINGVLQFPLTEQAFRGLGVKSLFFLVSDPSLAEGRRPGANREATAVLVAHGWTTIESEALLKPDYRFTPWDDLGDLSPAPFTAPGLGPTSHETACSTVVNSTSIPADGFHARSAADGKAPFFPLLTDSRQIQQYRRSMGLNRLLGLGLVIVLVGIFAWVLP